MLMRGRAAVVCPGMYLRPAADITMGCAPAHACSQCAWCCALTHWSRHVAASLLQAPGACLRPSGDAETQSGCSVHEPHLAKVVAPGRQCDTGLQGISAFQRLAGVLGKQADPSQVDCAVRTADVPSHVITVQVELLPEGPSPGAAADWLQAAAANKRLSHQHLRGQQPRRLGHQRSGGGCAQAAHGQECVRHGCC